MNKFFNQKKMDSSLTIPKYFKYFVRILYFFSKNQTIYLAARLFTTPITFKTPKREIGMKNSAQNKNLYVADIQKNIHLLSYGYSNNKVLLTHGWAGRSTQLFMIANYLLENGFIVISFDAPSHGKSSGKRTNLLEYIASIKAIHKDFGPFQAGIGHSFGAMAIVNTQAETPIFKKIVTIGSGDKMSDIIYSYAKNLGLSSKFGIQLLHYLNKKWQINSDDFSTSNAASKVNIPVLVIHDVLDKDFFVSCAINIRLNLQKGILFVTNGLGHTKILRNKEVSKKIINFLK